MFGFNSLFGNKTSKATPDAVKNNTTVIATGTLGALWRAGEFGKAIADVFDETKKEEPEAPKAEAKSSKPERTAADVAADDAFFYGMRNMSKTLREKMDDMLGEVTYPEPPKTEEPEIKPAEAAGDTKVEVTITVTTPQADKPTMAEEVIQSADLIRSQMAAADANDAAVGGEAKSIDVLSASDLAEAAEKLSNKHQSNPGKKR